MVRMSRNRPDVWLPDVALLVLPATVVLTYVSGALDTFRGSSPAHPGWALLGVSGALGSAVPSGARPPLTRPADTRVVRHPALSRGLMATCEASPWITRIDSLSIPPERGGVAR